MSGHEPVIPPAVDAPSEAGLDPSPSDIGGSEEEATDAPSEAGLDPAPNPSDALEERAARLDAAVAALAELDEPARAVVEELASAIDGLTKLGLTTMVGRLRQEPATKAVLFELLDQAEVRMLLGMHGIIRLPDAAQAEAAAAGRGADGSAPPRPGLPFFALDSLTRPRPGRTGPGQTGPKQAGPERTGPG